tara:strand:+ start:2569 stop:3321 length:753 start_codon:yes stop_codon:yes gene_type:complete
MNKDYKKRIIKNFDSAAKSYNQHAEIQKFFAIKLAMICTKKEIKHGKWIDLGAGTGILADTLEDIYPTQKVERLDSSKRMLLLNKNQSSKFYWDLNKGLPNCIRNYSLITSNFSLQWLSHPSQRLKEWFEALSSGGILAASIPIKGSFPEWEKASEISNTPYTAINLPESKKLIKAFNSSNIIHNEIYRYKQKSENPLLILKNISKVGAHSSMKKKMTISQLKNLKQSWFYNKQNIRELTWEIQILIIKK